MSDSNDKTDKYRVDDPERRWIDHENLDVYAVGREFLEFSNVAIKKLPKGISDLKNQLLSAASSITLNIAEGTGRRSTNDRKRFYNYADGSARECAAILDVLYAFEALDESNYLRGRELLIRIISMLNRMIR
jgi:four helix bundle protein